MSFNSQEQIDSQGSAVQIFQEKKNIQEYLHLPNYMVEIL